MNGEFYDLWEAMKTAKYSQTCEKLTKIIRASNGEVFDVMGTVLSTVAMTMHTSVGTLWYYDRKADGLIRPKAVFGGSDLTNVALLPGEGIAGKVIESNEPTVIIDCQSDPRWAGEVASGSSFITKTMICVPLSEEGEAYGCIQLINKTDDMLFDDKDFELAVKLAEIVSEEFNKYGYSNTVLRKTIQTANSIEQLINAEPEILAAAMERMPGYTAAGNFKKKQLLRIMNKLLDNLS